MSRGENINQNEMMSLAFGLRERNIRFEAGSFFDGLQIRCDGWDAVCHRGSYGHERGLIEVMGLPQCSGDVIGYLTAEEVLAMVDEGSDDIPPCDDERFWERDCRGECDGICDLCSEGDTCALRED